MKIYFPEYFNFFDFEDVFSFLGSIVFAVLIIHFILKRNIKSTMAWALFLLTAAFIVSYLYQDLRFPIYLSENTRYSYVPFVKNTGIATAIDAYILEYETVTADSSPPNYYLFTAIKYFFITFLYSAGWGITFPLVSRKKTLSATLISGACFIIPLSLLAIIAIRKNLLFGTYFYDTGSVLIQIVGIIVGFYVQDGIRKSIRRMRARREQSHD